MDKKSGKQKDKNSVKQILLIAFALSLVCSVVVSLAAVGLKPVQLNNKTLDMRINILRLLNLYQAQSTADDINQLFARIEPHIVDLNTGRFVKDIDANSYDLAKVANDPELSRPLNRQEDIARIQRRPNYMRIYLLKDQQGRLDKMIMPVYGYGLWSTLYGYLALKSDGQTIDGLRFYEHKETPGLGGEIDNPNWLALWHNKQLYDKQGQLRISVTRGRADRQTADFAYTVDGISGATLTSRGVSELVRFWFGPNGYQNFLHELKLAGSIHE